MSFNVNNRSAIFAGQQYPDLEVLKNVKFVSYNEQKEIVRLYFTEGIPNIFNGNPVMYEKIRSFLSNKFKVDAKYISLTGSGRLGYSLNPDSKKLGKPFENYKSDLDLFIIDDQMFKAACVDFGLYKAWLKTNPILSANKLALYKSNESLLENQIKHGFISQDKMPNEDIFKTIQSWHRILIELLKIMGDSKNCPQPKNASIRIYEDWESCINRITFNITDTISRYVI